MSQEQPQILVVDDESSSLSLLIDHFRGKPYELLYAKNGLDGCEIARSEIPDLILMDWAMPVMNGLDAILKLKSMPETWDIPVVMITGVMVTVDDLKEALDAGAVDYIRKPFDPVELTSRVQSMLRLGQAFREIKEKNKEIRELMERESQLLKEQLGQRERELAIQAMHAMEKDKFMKELHHRIREVEKDIPRDIPESFQNISKEIGKHIQAEKSWDNFMLHFEQVHPEFFKALRTQYPNLTNNDLRLSAYVKMGMDNKEIARLVGVETGTVKTNLHRLKQKLNLNHDDRVKDKIRAL